MKKTLLLVTLFCLFTVSSVFAQDKIAVIDIQAIILQSKAGAKASQELQAFAKTAQDKVKAKETELKKLNDSIQKQQKSLSASALSEKQLELSRKSRELESLQRDLQAELQQKEAIKLDAVAKELDPVIKDYATEKGISLVMLKQAGVVFYAPAMDITKEIISRFDAKWSKQGK